VQQWASDWKAACKWIEENTPPEATFITPREQQTFKWFAGRAEAANWKDVPQDAAALTQWKKTIDALYPGDRRHHQLDLAANSDEELLRLAGEYGAQYILVDRTRSQRPIGLRRVYPLLGEDNASFALYRVHRSDSP
jgi:hypothetical protein